MVGARRVAVEGPRVRTADGREVRLRIYDEDRDGRFLEEAAMAALVSCRSQRRYGQVARAMAPPGRRVFGLSASRAGRRFIAVTRRVAKPFGEGPIEGTFLAPFVDAVAFGGHFVVMAVGVRDDAEKVVLGIRLGDTESRAVCQELLEGMAARGPRGRDGGCWWSPMAARGSRPGRGRCSARPWSFSDAVRIMRTSAYGAPLPRRHGQASGG